ncbi:hypothetical protein JCM8547_000588 [Rhodosporidiobolus lusitaniae]
MLPSKRALQHRTSLLRTARTLPGSSSLLLSSSNRRLDVGVASGGGGCAGRLAETKRTFFGIGEILGVLTNPSEVLRSLSESKKLLEEARQELNDQREKSQIPPSHTFSPLPGFFDRPNEIKALQRALGSVPTFTVLFGASSTGKTALLRQVLSSDKYHVLHFDLRIAGFADLASLYFSLSTQLESYFAAIPDLLGREYGWGEFEKESWAFKHSRHEIMERLEGGGEVKTSDVAHLLELFQSALLSYWSFQPMTPAQRQRFEQRKKEDEEAAKDKKPSRPSSSSSSSSLDSKSPSTSSTSSSTSNPDPVLYASHHSNDPTEARMRQGAVPAPKLEKEGKDKEKEDLFSARSIRAEEDEEGRKGGRNKEVEEKRKREDEEDEEPKPPPKRVPCLFIDEAHKLPALIKDEESMRCLLDAFTTLTKQDRLLHVIHATSDPQYQTWLRQMNVMQHCQILSIGDTSKAEANKYFGTVLLPHIPDKIRHKISFGEVYSVFGGKLAHLGDYAGEFVNSDGEIPPLHSSHFLQAHSLLNLQLIHSTPFPSSASSAEGDDETDSPRGFRIMSSLAQASPTSAPSPYTSPSDSGPDFSHTDLLTVMRRLQPPSFGGTDDELPYFPLCRELGPRAVDGMVRGKVLELRWSRTITPEGDLEARRRKVEKEMREGVPKKKDSDGRSHFPVVVPTTPVVRYAMGEVLKEYEEEEEEVKQGREKLKQERDEKRDKEKGKT